MPELRAYQTDVIEDARRALSEDGLKRIILVAPTGAGKTVIASQVVLNSLGKDKRALFMVHRRELLKQAAEKLYAVGIDAGVVAPGFPSRPDQAVQVASIATLHARAIKSRRMDLPEADLIVVDECFPAGTLIDGRPIEEVRVGDFVESFDHETRTSDLRRVVRLFKSRPSSLVTVNLSDGRRIVCTPGHPFFTPMGYQPAMTLNCQSMVLSLEDEDLHRMQRSNRSADEGATGVLENTQARVLRDRLQIERAEETTEISDIAVREVRDDGGVRGNPRFGASPQGSGFLFGRMPEGVVAWSEVGDHGSYEPKIWFRTHEAEQSHGEPGDQSASIAGAQGDGAQAAGSWWEWHRHDQGGSVAFRGDGTKAIGGKDLSNQCAGISAPLQTGSSRPEGNALCGGRRGQPRDDQSKGAGSQEGRAFAWVRVDRVEVYEQAGDGRFGDLCRDGYVYNLEVEGTHNYFVDGVLVHNCHHSTAATWKALIEAYPDAYVVGLTATPCRADGRGLGTLFEALVECPDVSELVGQGFLVGTKVFAYVAPDLSKVKITAGDYNEKGLAEAMNTKVLVGDVIEHWQKYAENRKTLCYAVDVAHSIHLRDEFCRAGISAAHIDGKTPAEERDSILKQFADGVIDVVCNCNVLTEGFDCPDAGCIVLARPTKSFGLYRQMVGRGLRPAPGKPNCIVIDHAGLTLEHGFVDEPIQWTLKQDRKVKQADKNSRMSNNRNILADCPECGGARWKGKPCPSCGWRGQRNGSGVDFVDAELAELQRGQRMEREAPKPATDPRVFYGQLLWMCEERGWKSGWAYHKYREKFGVEPPLKWKTDQPIEPTNQVRSWVKSRLIAWIKAKEKQGGDHAY